MDSEILLRIPNLSQKTNKLKKIKRYNDEIYNRILLYGSLERNGLEVVSEIHLRSESIPEDKQVGK